MKIPNSIYPLALAGFLAPILGGGLLMDTVPADPGGMFAAMQGGPSGVGISFALLSGLVLVGLLWALLGGKVNNMPKPSLHIGFGLLIALIWFSVLPSGYKWLSVQSAIHWTAAIAAVYAAVCTAGVGMGVRVLLGSVMGGITYVAYKGISGFAAQDAPQWRIFSVWLDPNSLAGILLFGIFIACALIADCDRIGKLLSAIAGVLCGTALFLTGSKGGLVAFGAGLLAMAIVGAYAAGAVRTARSFMLPALAFLAVGLALSAGLRGMVARKTGADAGGLASRVTASGSSADQSVGVRKLLWESSGKLIAANPAGWGMGTFRFHSSRPGLVSPTQAAHNSFLQLGVEAGAAALLVILAVLGMSVVEGFRGLKLQPERIRGIKVCLFGALVAGAVHNLGDSDLYHMGYAIPFFLTVGIWLSLSVDSVVPEFAKKGPRAGAAIAVPLLTILALWLGWADWQYALLSKALRDLNGSDYQVIFKGMLGAVPNDFRMAQAEANLAQGHRDTGEEARRLKVALERGPTIAAYRAFGKALYALNDIPGARRALDRALQMDPNNLGTMSRFLEEERKIGPDESAKLAERMIAVEQSSAYRFRAIPEFVLTETADARGFLASLPGCTPDKQLELLGPALEIYARYARQTVPQVMSYTDLGLDGGYMGTKRSDAEQVVRNGYSALKIYRRLPRADGRLAADVESALREADSRFAKSDI